MRCLLSYKTFLHHSCEIDGQSTETKILLVTAITNTAGNIRKECLALSYITIRSKSLGLALSIAGLLPQ